MNDYKIWLLYISDNLS